MNVEPSGREGQRVPSPSDPPPTDQAPASRADLPLAAGTQRPRIPLAAGAQRPRIDRRAGLGGLLVILAVAMGIAVGGGIGSAADERSVAVSPAESAFSLPAVATPPPSLSSPPPSLSSPPAPAVERVAMVSPPRPRRSVMSGVAIEALPIYEAALPVLPAREEPDRSSGSAQGMDVVEARAEPSASEPREDGLKITRGRIKRGESLGSALRRQGIKPRTVHLIATEMRGLFDFRHSRPGDRFRLGQDAEGRVLDFRYAQNEEESYSLAWDGARYVAQREDAKLYPVVARIAGVVDSSFYGAIVELGEQSALASEFARILAWDIDFGRQVHPGDEFQILYERLYRTDDDGEDVYVRPGRVLAGRYTGQAGDHTVVYFEEKAGEGAYFRPDGRSIERAFLAAPLAFSRISSRFTRARVHPILNVTRPHPGIDYAAPHGTPVWAVAEGVVEYRARAGASGNLVRIRHDGGLTSHYAHLQNFAEGLKVGDRVEQKQVIGYVGSTGLSTGPHVCFRVKQNGKYVDPMKLSGPSAEPVAAANLPAFRSARDRLLADLEGAQIALVEDGL